MRFRLKIFGKSLHRLFEELHVVGQQGEHNGRCPMVSHFKFNHLFPLLNILYHVVHISVNWVGYGP